MKNRASCVVRRAVLAAGLVASALSAAAGYTPVKSISAGAYVQRGLVAHWDGIEKAEDVAADGWTDLKGGVTLGPRIPDGGSIVTGTKYVRLSGACLHIDSTTDAAAIAANKAFAGAQKTVEIAGNGEGPTDTKWVSALEVVPTTAQKRIFLWYNGGNGVELDTLLLKGDKFPRTGLQLVNNTDFTAALAFTTVKDFIPYQDGVAKRPVIADNVGTSDPTEAHITLGSWDSTKTPQTGTKMEFHALRVYNVTLTPEEVRYNAWLDRVRFSNEELPEGLFVTEEGAIEAEVTVTFGETQGCVSNKGVAVQSGSTIRIPFIPGSGSALLTAEPKEGFCITGVRGESAVVDRVAGTIAVDMLSGYLADGSAVPSALEVKFVKPGKAVSEKSYVRRGLAAQWDGIVKGENVPEDGWTDLIGGVTLKTDEGRESGITTDAKSVFVDSVRFYDASAEATALVKTIAAHNSTVEVAAKMPDETSAHMIFSAVTPANGGGLDERVLLWYCEAAATNKRRYYYIKTGSGFAFDNTGLPAVGEARFTESLTLSTDKFTCFRNGALAYSRAVALPACTVTDGCLALNCISSSRDPSVGKMTYNGVRIYGAYLSAAEQLVNSNIDKVRFDGVDPTALTWPEGFRCVVDWLEAKVTVTYDETQGTLLDANGDPVRSGVATWVPADGAEVKLTAQLADGMGVAAVEGTPAAIDYANNVITLSATGTVTCAADIARKGPTISEHSYVRRGLAAQWDGIAKGENVPEDGWADLIGGVTLKADEGGESGITTDAKSVFVDSVRFYDTGAEATALVKTIATHNSTVEVAAKLPDETATRIIFSAVTPATGGTEKERVLLWYCAGSQYPRYYCIKSGSSFSASSAGMSTTGSARFTESLCISNDTFTCLRDGVKGCTRTGIGACAVTDGCLSLNCISPGRDPISCKMTYNGVRIYGSCLSDAERVFNSNLDKVRFDGDDPAKLAWPEGIRYRGNWLEARVTLNYDETRGTILANGQQVESGVATWVAIDGGAVKLELADADGMEMTSAEGAPAAFDFAHGTADIFAFGSPTVEVFIQPVGERIIETTYVHRGLVAHWDGINKSGNVATDGWTDLVGGVTLRKMSDAGNIDTNGKSVRLAGAALWDNGAGAVNLVQTLSKMDVTFEVVSQTSSSSPFIFSAVSDENKTAESNRLFFWYNGERTMYHAAGSYPGFWKTGFTPAQNTLDTETVRLVSPKTLEFWRDGVYQKNKTDLTSFSPYTGETGSVYLNALSKSGGAQTATIDYSGVRIYDVKLTDDEIAFNAAVDQVRFSNVNPAEVTWPAGISYNAAERRLEVEVTVTYDAARGSIAVNGVAVPPGVATKVPYRQGAGTVVCTPSEKCFTFRGLVVNGEKVAAEDGQATVDGLLSVRTFKAKLGGGGLRLILR